MSLHSPEPGSIAAVQRLLQLADRGAPVTGSTKFLTGLKPEDKFQAQLALLLRGCCAERRLELSCAELKNILGSGFPIEPAFLVLRNGVSFSLRDGTDLMPARFTTHGLAQGILLEVGDNSINTYGQLSPDGVRQMDNFLPFPANSRWSLESYDRLERRLVVRISSDAGDSFIELNFEFSETASISFFPKRKTQADLSYGLWSLISDKSGLDFYRELNAFPGKGKAETYDGFPFFTARFEDVTAFARGALVQDQDELLIKVVLDFPAESPAAENIKFICRELNVSDGQGNSLEDLCTERMPCLQIKARIDQAQRLADCLGALRLMTKTGWME